MSVTVRAPARPLILALIAALAIAILPAGAARPVLAASPDVVISEVYGGGGNAGATYTHDFIELFNRGSCRSLAQWLVGPVRRRQRGRLGDDHLTNVSLAPGQSYLVQESNGLGRHRSAARPPMPSARSRWARTSGKVALAQHGRP